MSYIVGILVIAYCLFIFPCFLGTFCLDALDTKAQKDANNAYNSEARNTKVSIKVSIKESILEAYLYGMTMQICFFLCVTYAFSFFDISLSKISKSYLLFVGIVSIGFVWLLISKIIKDKNNQGNIAKVLTLKISLFSKNDIVLYDIALYGIPILIMAIFVFFRKDTSVDSIIKNAMSMLYSGRIEGDNLRVTYMPVYYAVLADLSHLPVAMITKLIVPFSTIICFVSAYKKLLKNNLAVGFALLLSLLFSYGNDYDISTIWTASWSGFAILYAIFIPVCLWIFLDAYKNNHWNLKRCILLLASLLGICFSYNRCFFEMYKKQVTVIGLLFALICLMALVGANVFTHRKQRNNKDGKISNDKKSNLLQFGIVSALAIAFCIFSVATKGFIFTNSSFEVLNNKYKIDRDIMELRMLLEPVENGKILADVKIMDQIEDCDNHVAVLFDSENVNYKDSSSDPMIYGAAADLDNHDFSDEKLIQHGIKFACTHVVTKKNMDKTDDAVKTDGSVESDEAQKARDDLYYQYGFLPFAETEKYVIYSYVGEDLWSYTVTQYPSVKEDYQSSIYVLRDMAQHVIIVDGGFFNDADNLKAYIIKQCGGKVDAWILTHFHPDHIGAFNVIYESGEVDIGQIYVSPIDYDVYKKYAEWWDEIEFYEKYLELTKDAKNIVELHDGDELDVCGLKMDVFHSYDYDELLKAKSKDPCNDGALMFKLSGRENSMLFLSDVGARMSDFIIENHKDELKSDYVQMGHHGNGGSSEELLELVHPSVAFFDCPDNILYSEQYNAIIKKAFMENMGAEVLSYATAPNSVILK